MSGVNCPPMNPCTCVGTSSPVTPPVIPCPPGDCLVVCDIVVLSHDGVGPCGQSGMIDVTDTDLYGHNFDICEANPVFWSVHSIEGGLAGAEITPAGVLSWITGGPETAGKYSTITLKVCCDCYSAFMCVVIGTADLCNCPGCLDCEDCDPCTGDCLDSGVEMTLEGVQTIT